MPYIGEIAGLLTSLFFAANAIVISRAGAEVGSVIVNRTACYLRVFYISFSLTLSCSMSLFPWRPARSVGPGLLSPAS